MFYENKRVGFYLFKIFILLGIYYLVKELFLNELNIKVINFMSKGRVFKKKLYKYFKLKYVVNKV